MTFGNYIYIKRKELNLSQKALAEKLNVSVSTISKWETDERLPDLFTLGKIVQIFGVDIESFLRCESKKSNNFAEIYEFNAKYFAEYLKKLRKKSGLSLNEVANQLGVTYQTVSKWESGDSYPGINLLLDIAKLYETSIHEIYFAKSEEKIQKETKYKPNIISIILCAVSALFIIVTSVLLGIVFSNNDLGEKVSVKFDFVDDKYDTVMLIEKGSRVEKYSPLIEGHYITYYVDNIDFNFDTFIYEDIVIECVLNELEYNVKFYGWEKTLVDSQKVKYKKSAVPPQIEVLDENYEFVGFDKDYNCVTEDLDIYSIFKYKFADITFDPNGGECDLEYFYDYDSTKFGQLPVASLKGHTFLGWYLNGEIFTDKMEVYEPIVLKAEYSANTYKITLDCEDGMIAGDKEIPVVYGTIVNLPTPLLNEYIFDCWLYEGEPIPNEFTYSYDHNITLHAKYKASFENIEYVSDEKGLKITRILEGSKTIVLPSMINNEPVVGINGYIFDEYKDIIETIYFPEMLQYFPEGLLDNCYKLKRIGLQQTLGYASVGTLFNTIPDSLIEVEIYGLNIPKGTVPEGYVHEVVTGFHLLNNNQNRTFHLILNLQINKEFKGDWKHRSIIGTSYAHELTSYCPFPLEFEGPDNIRKINLLGLDANKSIFIRYIDAVGLEEITFAKNAYCLYAYYTKSKIKSIIIPEGTNKVGATFKFLNTLEEITIPKTVVEFYDGAFADTGNIKRINYNGTIEDWLKIEGSSDLDFPFKQNPNAKLYINGELVEDIRLYQ